MNPTRWTAESVARLGAEDLRQLRDNALGLGSAEVVALCETALGARGRTAPRSHPGRAAREKSKLVPRRAAFQMRGVHLGARMSSWGGVRDSDGMVVLSLWAEDVRRENGGCSCLLWTPNEKGSRPWSDTPAGKERLQHRKLALEHGRAEGFLVYGVRQEGFLPEERAQTIKGADPHVLIVFQVAFRSAAYWAVWGGKAAG